MVQNSSTLRVKTSWGGCYTLFWLGFYSSFLTTSYLWFCKGIHLLVCFKGKEFSFPTPELPFCATKYGPWNKKHPKTVANFLLKSH